MDGFEVVTMDQAVTRADIFVTATGNEDVITGEHMKAMKNMAIVSNIGHFDSEIQIAALSNYDWKEIKPGTDRDPFTAGRSEERRGGKECVSTGRSGRSPEHEKNKN